MLSVRMMTAAKLLAAIGIVTTVALCAGAAHAAEPWWQLSVGATPTYLAPEGAGKIVVAATDIGDAGVNASTQPVTVTDTLPAGLAATAVSGSSGFGPTNSRSLLQAQSFAGTLQCSVATPQLVSCTLHPDGTLLPVAVLQPDERIEMEISVQVQPGASSGELDEASVSGGEPLVCHEVAGTGRFTDEACHGVFPYLEHSHDFEAEGTGVAVPGTDTSWPITISSEAVPFGVERYEFLAEEEGGAPDTLAGSHPFQLATTLVFNQQLEQEGEATLPTTLPAPPRSLHFSLPAGFVGNAQATPRCSATGFFRPGGASYLRGAGKLFPNQCPADTAVGVAMVTIIVPNAKGSGYHIPLATVPAPVFNLEPSEGEPARFGISVVGQSILLDTSLRSGGDYGVSVDVDNISQVAAPLASRVILWGVPGAAVHNAARGWSCIAGGFYANGGVAGEPVCDLGAAGATTPLLTLPTACGESLPSPMEMQSWLPGAGFSAPLEPLSSTGLQRCAQLPFEPHLEVESSADEADSPTQLTVHLDVPQGVSEEPGARAEADVKNTTVALPSGLQINPAAAAGLAACTEADIGYQGRGPSGELRFSPETEAERLREAPPATGCPPASKIGTVKITTPLLEEELTGSVFQAAQGANPFGSLLALYVVAEAPRRGVRVRLAGEIEVESNGQLVSTFPMTPQLPFEELTLSFFGGAKSPVATTGCGIYKTESTIEPWSSIALGAQLAHPTSEFVITAGVGGAPCPNGGAPFAPSFEAGSTNNQAGAFSPFKLALARGDGEQPLSTVAMKLPLGLAGMISHVEQCPDAAANLGDCPSASKIGHVVVRAGVGSEPVMIPEAGKPEDPVYLTGPYKGAPFGVAIVVPAEAGPFNLDEGGHPVVVRGKVNVDPHTARVSIESDPMPTRLQGIALDVRDIEVAIDKPEFMFNPTNCEAMALDGTIGSAEGASKTVSSRFQAANCAALPFKPRLTAETHAHHTHKGGAFLRVKVTSGSGQANIAKVHVKLPRKLPADVDTLKQACLEAQFVANPAECPKGSFVGTAVAHTPVLSSPLQGPAIYVSNGHQAFPNLDVVLQGEGVTVILEGSTFISKKGYTSSTFASVPDVPVSSFTLTLPEGEDPALGGNGGNLCSKTVTKHVKKTVHGKVEHVKRRVKRKLKLTMPTTITGQNGAVIEKTTVLHVAGCAARRHGKKGSRKGRSKA